MSLFFKRDANLASTLLAERWAVRSGVRGVRVNREEALRNSAVWACLRLRADLLSTMPLDVFSRVDGVQIEQPRPAVLTTTGGPSLRFMEWSYSTQIDLDSCGNTVGLVLERDGYGLPALIEPFDIDAVSFIGHGSKIEKVRVGNVEYPYAKVWHEKQYTRAGLAVGLSPIAYAAYSLNSYLSAQEFAQDWFTNSTVPGGHLKNTARTLNKQEAAAMKESFKASVASGDVWVSGNDWQYDMLAAKASEAQFLETMEATVADVCRYLGVPGDMIDAPSKGSSVTYANITQRNMQLLVMNLGPAIARREEAWTHGLLPLKRYAKLNPDALLRMDLTSRYAAHKVGIDGRFLTPNEARAYENLPPLTPEQMAEFNVLSKVPTPVAPTTPKEGQ